MAEILHIVSPRIDRSVVCEAIGVVPKAPAWKSLDWKDGRAKLRLEAIEPGEEFSEIIDSYIQLFEEVAEGKDLIEIKKRLRAAKWLLRITATPDFEATAADSDSIASIAIQLDGTCIASHAVIDPGTGDVILSWDDLELD